MHRLDQGADTVFGRIGDKKNAVSAYPFRSAGN